MNKIKSLIKEAVLLERSVPSVVSALFILSIVAMNLLANKSITLPFDWLALDCGIIFSWLVFLLMDMVTKHFGPRAATTLSIIALISVNLGVINLLPLPVLDGGYLLILIIEAITRKKLGGKAMEITIVIGWILILLLFAFTMWNDIARVFGLN